MNRNPVVFVDWDSGATAFEPGQRLRDETPVFQVEMLASLSLQVRGVLRAAQEMLCKGFAGRRQRVKNALRREAAESIVGLTVVGAKSLSNGDMALTFSDGNTLVFSGGREDIGVFYAASIECASQIADASGVGSIFTAEPVPDDERFAQCDAAVHEGYQVLGLMDSVM